MYRNLIKSRAGLQYGREIKDWIAKAHREAEKPNTTVVCLIRARTDTSYWHEHCMNAAEIILIKGRLSFGDGSGSAPFPSALVVFGNSIIDRPLLSAIDR